MPFPNTAGPPVRTILVAEKDPRQAHELASHLEAAGHRTLVACDALHTLAQAVRGRPDLIISELALPGGDGFCVAGRLRLVGPAAPIPIIFLTDRRRPGLSERAWELGAVALVRKPCAPDALMDVVDRVLNGVSVPGATSGSRAD